MEPMRKPFQGVGNIIRFNWHFYVLALIVIGILFLFKDRLPENYELYVNSIIVLTLVTTFLSLLVSFYIYDLSSLYQFDWLDDLQPQNPQTIVNIHAGFDETSAMIRQKFSQAELIVFDFYDPVKHTEISIRRARIAYPPYPGTQSVSTIHLPLPDQSMDLIFLIFAAHEIRNDAERNAFFTELQRIIKPCGNIILTEHLRDLPNLLAYNLGFFHFLSKSSWLKTFAAAGLIIKESKKMTPFITTYILEKNGTAS